MYPSIQKDTRQISPTHAIHNSMQRTQLRGWPSVQSS